jgi:hypothetical protein
MKIPTVDVQPIKYLPALKMIWQHKVVDKDVITAFESITTALNNSKDPLYVVVDLLNNPNFPLMVTIQNALEPYRHPQLQEWLIVGSNWMARTIEGTLSKITRHKNVRWFDTEDDALNYLKSVLGDRMTSY